MSRWLTYSPPAVVTVGRSWCADSLKGRRSNVPTWTDATVWLRIKVHYGREMCTLAFSFRPALGLRHLVVYRPVVLS